MQEKTHSLSSLIMLLIYSSMPNISQLISTRVWYKTKKKKNLPYELLNNNLWLF